MAVNSFTIRIMGNVSYSDETHDEITASMGYEQEGAAGGRTLISGSSYNDTQAVRNIMAQSTSVNQFLQLILPTVVSTNAAAPTDGKTVTSFGLHISGNVTEDDNTNTSFDYELHPDGTVTDHQSGTSDTAFANVSTSDISSHFDMVLNAVGLTRA